MTDLAARRGRPRSEEADRAIEAAAVELLVEVGFAGMSIEAIAARAGVGKATIYRRWPAKEDLVVQAVTRRCAEEVVIPDTGSLRDDLLVMFGDQLRRYRRDGDILRAFAAEQWRHPELASAFRANFLTERRAAIRAVFERAVARGELPEGTDVQLLADLCPALLWHRMAVTGDPLGDDLPARLVEQFFSPR